MGNIRIHELAKKLCVASKKLIEELKKQGVEVKSHMSTIDQETADVIMEVFSAEKKQAPATQPHLKAALVEKQPAIKAKRVQLSEAITVKELCEKLGQKPGDVIKKLMEMGILAAINQVIDMEAAVVVAKKFGIDAEVVSAQSEAIITEAEAEQDGRVPKAPVVTIMGHVDHGKTSLLDAIRQTKVTLREVGGITQHIGAYEVALNKGKITFLDTPGHEAFTAMRARGAQVTDLVVLVVAADDGVMPQTREAIDHARAAGVPIVVAINKIDKAEAKPERVRQELSELGLVPEGWGGQTIYVDISAKKQIGIDNLLDMILLQAEMLELKANPNRLAKGTVVEAKLDKARGPVATVLVQQGTLRVSDPFVAGVHFGKVRALINDRGKKVEAAGPSTPVEILGLSGVPMAGDSFLVFNEEKRARQIAGVRLQKQREAALAKSARVTLEDLHKFIEKGVVKELNIIAKADVQGSVQVLTEALEKLGTEEVKLRVIHGAPGGITESDVLLAAASNAISIGFNVRPTPKAVELAHKENVDIRLYSVIYDVIGDIKAAMEGLLEPKLKEVVLGRAEVRQLFNIPRAGVVAGCYVLDGTVHRDGGLRLIRENLVVYTGKASSLRRFKDDVKEVAAGFECGIGIERFQDLKVGDIIEFFTIEKEARTL